MTSVQNTEEEGDHAVAYEGMWETIDCSFSQTVVAKTDKLQDFPKQTTNIWRRRNKYMAFANLFTGLSMDQDVPHRCVATRWECSFVVFEESLMFVYVLVLFHSGAGQRKRRSQAELRGPDNKVSLASFSSLACVEEPLWITTRNYIQSQKSIMSKMKYEG